MPAGQPEQRKPVEGGLQSVLTALDVLDCFAHEEELGISDVARRIGVAKSTAHRLLTTLCARGMAEQNPETGRYRLGMKLFALGQLAANRSQMHKIALPLLADLKERTGATIHLAIPDGVEMLYVERLETFREMALMSAVPRRVAAHATSSGKCVAAFDEVFANARLTAGLPPETQRTLGSARDYRAALLQIRQRGYAVSIDEAVVGLTSVAAPVFDRAGKACAAISIVGPTPRILANVGGPARLVQSAATVLARQLCR
ncbi:MAG: transcriptional regulator, IclR family [Frankiales bacterium]|jgi:DNA-binding IclR family transcriptional regulator|nr:transcriptional regulator, IclR family [Frankiales bacterium]